MSRCAKLWVELVRDSTGEHFTTKLPCGSWGCDDCKKVNAAKLRRDIRAALKGWMEVNDYDPAKFRFWCKFLTLTLPGSEWRGKYPPAVAEEMLKQSWRKLRNHLRKRLGDFEYVQVDELQPSGYPHLHVMLLGPGIAGKEVLGIIRSFWCGHLGMGNVDLEVIYDLEGAAVYLTKYISKGKTGNLRKGNRVYSFSKGLRRLIADDRMSRKEKVTLIRIGAVNSDGSLGRVFWESSSGLDWRSVLERENLEALLSYFEGKCNDKGEQCYFWEVGYEGEMASA